MLGLVTMPAGLMVGGLLSGLSAAECIWQNLPVFVLALFLLAGLKFIPEKMIRGFCFLAEGIKVVITAGLVLAAVEYMCGFPLVKGMAPLMDAMEVAASIGIVMLGSLPAAEFLRRILAKPFTRLGGRLGMKAESMTGMLIGLVSVLPALSLYKDMDDKGKVACSAFLVSGASLLAAHMGFVVSTEPEMLGALLGGKLSGALAAAALAVWAERSRKAADRK